ncbi:ankyrin repeat-containing protein BDA1 isoform X2 [Ziziphus jujuba]|uniref:Ankyrin repeat-containing protein BDA1 isoform X2 n=1 Tax=Ziziphus jujuba TaxID=326968 RepID=A0ABM4A024_ZIZJJ|nr:ankyrin repeat-containing protein BDA1 isoform X2 [Ziziphus jujuba]
MSFNLFLISEFWHLDHCNSFMLASCRMECHERLKIVAQEGDIDMFYNLLAEDPYLLDHKDTTSFIHTPLHIAASHGKILFAMEMIILKPSYARKLNHHGLSPMHLAVLNRQTDMVREFLHYESDLVRVRGREGKTPLHFLAEKGHDHVHHQEKLCLLTEFLSACSLCIQDVTNRSETALHIAVKNQNFDAFDCLLQGLRRSFDNNDIRNVIELKDGEGNNVLHIATATNQYQVVKLLLKSKIIDVNAKNSKGLTALDISDPHNREVREFLLHGGALNAKSLPQVLKDDGDNLRSNISFKENVIIFVRRFKNNTSSNLSLILLAAILIAPAAVSPLGGVWQDNKKPLKYFVYHMANIITHYLMVLFICLLLPCLNMIEK